MKYYAGLDVAMKETFICVLSEEGERIFESKSPTDPQPIYDELAKSGVELEKVGLESGSLSNYLIKGLQDLGVLPHARLGMESLLKSYKAMHDEIVKIEKSLNEICKHDEDDHPRSRNDCSFNIQSRYGRPGSF